LTFVVVYTLLYHGLLGVVGFCALLRLWPIDQQKIYER
jgi:hypothetical protein